MFNRFYEQRQLMSDNITAKPFKTNTKITVLTVYEMMEQKKRSIDGQDANPKDIQPNEKNSIINIRYDAQEKSKVQDTYDRFRSNLEEFRKNVRIGKYNNFRQKMMTLPGSNKECLPWASRSLEKAKQRKLLNETMKIMSNNIYSAHSSPKRFKKMESEVIIDIKSIQNFVCSSKTMKREQKITKKQKIKEKFRSHIRKISTQSSSILESNTKSNLLGYDIKGMSMEDIIAQQSKQSPERLNLIDKGVCRQVFFNRQAHSKFNQSQSKEKLPFYHAQLKKMVICLDIILLSFQCVLKNEEKRLLNQSTFFNLGPKSSSLTSKRANKAFYYYLGTGNNHLMIREIMKKRGWWMETDSIEKAHLVWTQLKVQQVLDKLERQVKSSDTIQSKYQVSIYENILTEPVKNQKATHLLKLFHKKHTFFSCQSSEKDQPQKASKIRTPEVLHNHYENNYQFGDKNQLFFNLKTYYQYLKKDLSKIIPETYYLNADSLEDIQHFQRAFHMEKDIWIVKPAENSNRGRKIILSNSLEQITTKLNIQRKLIVQKYLKNILLYEGRKFDIRAYLLAISINGSFKYYFYSEGYLRTSSFPFSTQNIKDRYVHLTNDAVQQFSEHYGRYQEGNKVSYSEFQRYLSSKYPKKSYDVDQLHEQMKDICLEVVKATYHKVDPKRKRFGFEIFGLDYIVDSQFKPVLIEVNTNPCLELSSQGLERLIPLMLQNMFRLAVDPLFRPSVETVSKIESYYLYDSTFLQKNKFHLIFDENFDRDSDWEKYSSSHRIQIGQAGEPETEEFLEAEGTQC